MDLFVINRYLGERNEGIQEEGEQLDRLLQKIEERKKKKFENQEPDKILLSSPQHSSELNNDFSQENNTITDSSIQPTDDDNVENFQGKENVDLKSFTVIEAKKFKNNQRFKSVLPHWLANPEIIPTNLKELSTPVDAMSGLDEDLVEKLRKENITHFFPVQCKVIPFLLSELRKTSLFWPCDVCVSSPTGSGKTLAFVLPIVQTLKTRVDRKIRALVVLPVQDLAAQVYEVFKYYCSGTDLRVELTTTRTPFHLEQKKLVKESVVNGFYSWVDILVTTPGRLVGHLQTTAGFSLKNLQFLVIDEADRVTDKVQSNWLHYLRQHIDEVHKELPLSVATLRMIPRPPQKLLFSATLSQDPEKLHQLSLFQPKLFTSSTGSAGDDHPTEEIGGALSGKYATPQELTEYYCITSPEKKPVLLYHLMQTKNWKHVICFTYSQKISHRLYRLLHHISQGEIVVMEISAALKQAERDLVLRRFEMGEIHVLVSTDALARGMDLPNVDCVVSYSMPKFMRNYIHRVGRTGRAGKSGSAVTFVTQGEQRHFVDMLKNAGKEIGELPVSEQDLGYLSECYQAACKKLGQEVQGEKVKVNRNAKLQKRGLSTRNNIRKKSKKNLLVSSANKLVSEKISILNAHVDNEKPKVHKMKTEKQNSIITKSEKVKNIKRKKEVEVTNVKKIKLST
ncbi:probable ATP-dependent RNA helicase Dbp73D [Bacillus rossius redtenbacheri]|uniref:probable ATP-dependent RNA helicase Dbp73D n=1 Tax=Bacillus rossius redtenbacheri TaxID=93214 RepID=UPI002FDDA711